MIINSVIYSAGGGTAVAGIVTPEYNKLSISGLPFNPQHIMILKREGTQIRYGMDNWYSSGGTTNSGFVVTCGTGEITVTKPSSASMQFSGSYYYAVWAD